MFLGLSLSIFSQEYDINGNYTISGNIGIGTDQPTKKLEVAGGGFFTGSSRNVLLNVSDGSTEYTTLTTGGWTMGSKFFNSNRENMGGWRVYGSGDRLLYYYVGEKHNEPLLAVNPNGNVGIGTSNPTRKLEITNDLLVSGNRNILIDASQGSMKYTANSGGWTMGSEFLNSTNESLGGWRAYGNRSSLLYYYVGDNYQDPLLTINPNGGVGIGTKSPQSKLAVNGTITSTEIVVTAEGWSDFEFSNDYNLLELKEVENFIQEHNHLPDIPSEQEILENGIAVGEMNAKLLQKIEELTLYMIESNKKTQYLVEKMAIIASENDTLKKEISLLKTK